MEAAIDNKFQESHYECFTFWQEIIWKSQVTCLKKRFV